MKWFVAENNLHRKENWSAHPAKEQTPEVWASRPTSPDQAQSRLKGGRKGTIKTGWWRAGRFPAKYNFQSGRSYRIRLHNHRHESPLQPPPMFCIYKNTFFTLPREWCLRTRHQFTLPPGRGLFYSGFWDQDQDAGERGDLKRWQRTFIPPANSLSAEIHLEHLYTAVDYRNCTWKCYKCPPNPQRLKWRDQTSPPQHTQSLCSWWGWVKSPGWEATGRAQVGTHWQEWGLGWGKPGGRLWKLNLLEEHIILNKWRKSPKSETYLRGKKREKFGELKQSSSHWKMSPS